MDTESMVNDPALQQFAPKWKGKSANHSKLMKLLGQTAEGGVANICPFGCQDEDHDENSYCHHVIGFTVSHKDASKGENRKVMEPLGYDKRGNRAVDGAKRCLVPEGAVLERITNLSRVYFKDAPKPVRPNFDDLDVPDEDEVEDELPKAKKAKLKV